MTARYPVVPSCVSRRRRRHHVLVAAASSLRRHARGLHGPVAAPWALVETDADGRYRIGRLADPPASTRLTRFTVVIYKRGYVAYRSDRRFDDFGPRTDFTQTHHEVRLERWRSDISHVRHLRYIGGGPTLAVAKF